MWNGTGPPVTNPPTIVTRSAHCEVDEVCITTFRHTQEANCVKSLYFVLMMESWNGVQTAAAIVDTMAAGDTRNSLDLNLSNTSASMVLSDISGTRPIEVDTLRVDAGVGGEADPRQSKKCRDCIDLETDRFEPDTDFLKTQTRLLTTGAAAGILWLAIMSG